MNSMKPDVDGELQKLQCETFAYFLHETNPANGLVIDKTAPDWPSSISATGLALACYPVSIERGFMSRADASLARGQLRGLGLHLPVGTLLRI